VAEESDDGDIGFAGVPEDDDDEGDDGGVRRRHRIYMHRGRFWHVPEHFQLDNRMKLRPAFRLWLEGMPGHEIRDPTGRKMAAPIRPFRLLKSTFLPKSVKQKLEVAWRPIFKLMEQAPGVNLPDGSTNLTADEFDHLYETCFEYVKTQRLAYVYSNPNMKPPTWSLSTWSKWAQPSMVRQHGLESDKMNLPPETRFNRSRTQRRKRQRQPMQAGRRRVTPRGRPRGTLENTDDNADQRPEPLQQPPTNRQRRDQQQEHPQTFEEAFGDVMLPEHLQERAREIEEQVRDEVMEEQRQNNRRGDVYITRPAANRLRQDIGNTTHLDRQRFAQQLEVAMQDDNFNGRINLGVDPRDPR